MNKIDKATKDLGTILRAPEVVSIMEEKMPPMTEIGGMGNLLLFKVRLRKRSA